MTEGIDKKCYVNPCHLLSNLIHDTLRCEKRKKKSVPRLS